MDIYREVEILAQNAKRASCSLALLSEKEKNAILLILAELLCQRSEEIIKANSDDLVLAEENSVPRVKLDRLMINEKRIREIAESIRSIAALDDPIGKGEVWTRPSGITLRRVRVPLGVVGIIYEARPNVTVDSAALCIKTGNDIGYSQMRAAFPYEIENQRFLLR